MLFFVRCYNNTTMMWLLAYLEDRHDTHSQSDYYLFLLFLMICIIILSLAIDMMMHHTWKVESTCPSLAVLGGVSSKNQCTEEQHSNNM